MKTLEAVYVFDLYCKNTVSIRLKLKNNGYIFILQALLQTK